MRPAGGRSPRHKRRLKLQPVLYLIPLAGTVAILLNACVGRFACDSGGDRLTGLIHQLQGQSCCYRIRLAEVDPAEVDLSQHCKVSHRNMGGFLFRNARYQCSAWAALCLGATEDAAAVPALIAALESGPNNYDTGDGVIWTRYYIMQALGRIGDERAVQPLIDALHSPKPIDASPTAWGHSAPEPVGEVSAMKALGLLGAKAAIATPDILPFLESQNARKFRVAANALGDIGDPSTIPALIAALDHPTEAASVARALGKFGPEADAAAPILIEMLQQSPDMRGSALVVTAIANIRGRDAVPPVTRGQRLTSPQP